MELTHDHIFRLTADPALYAEVPFLAPLKTPALQLHEQVKKYCRHCNKAPLRMAKNYLAGELAKLLLAEAKKQPNQLPQFKKTVAAILRLEIGELLVMIRPPQGEHVDIRF